ncbi:NAD-dependent epimerase/dehydratase family protein [Paenibacillus turpanensis]|uniref:NAD-dependent epimerase/dehydratase family protein n=1 Tax=Paenibacillus turpanensis TaxID=2689078 RepID=UPI001409AFD6|nr:NAD-dependent epimerase/dehydratase family protein [Paenibacillus turpanensis]
MNIFVTGGTGFVGSAMMEALVANGHNVYALVRKTGALAGRHNITEVCGDLLQPESYTQALEKCEAVIHLVGIIREQPAAGVTFERIHLEGTKQLAAAAKKAGISRFVHMSALGAREGAVSAYHRTKYEAERMVSGSGIPYVIFRPSVIFGPGDEFVNMLAGLVRMPLTPVIGDGNYRLQPVSLRNVASLFVKAAEGGPSDVCYELGGPDALTYNAMLREIGEALNRKVRLVHAPLAIMKPVIYAMDRFPFFPITRHQLTMLLEENIVRGRNTAPDVYGEQLVPFAKGIREYLK